MLKRIITLAAFALIPAMAACDGPSPTGPINIEIDPDPSIVPTDASSDARQSGGRQAYVEGGRPTYFMPSTSSTI